MPHPLKSILLVFAFVFFVIGTFCGYPSSPTPNNPWYWRFNLISAGLACWVFVELTSSF
jgi:ABC-type multidrug transport system permease subunit